ncbi:hypothetical protein BX600DRAFT_430718 [Xylariales sp. PMI_506]|nr:hypothetical protein BX600DRAFT_430718 [Xylariales sp. PMI_506]
MDPSTSEDEAWDDRSQSRSRSHTEEAEEAQYFHNGRECYICRDITYPTYEEQSMLGRLRGKKPKRVYIHEEMGRLISPCLCKGSMKFVHEECLQAWRYSQNGSQNKWKCPTCKFEYKFERLDWARRVRSPLLAFGLAIVIFIFCLFLLGFVGDHILSLWLDPVGTLMDGLGSHDLDPDDVVDLVDFDENGWGFHFLKGFLSLGLLGFVKSFLAMGPWQWWNLRTSGLLGGGGGRRRGTGRDRMENISLTLVAVGAVTVFWAVWSGTRKWTQRVLDKTSERFVNIQEDNDDQYEEAVPDGEDNKKEQ